MKYWNKWKGKVNHAVHLGLVLLLVMIVWNSLSSQNQKTATPLNNSNCYNELSCPSHRGIFYENPRPINLKGNTDPYLFINESTINLAEAVFNQLYKGQQFTWSDELVKAYILLYMDNTPFEEYRTDLIPNNEAEYHILIRPPREPNIPFFPRYAIEIYFVDGFIEVHSRREILSMVKIKSEKVEFPKCNIN